MNPKNKADLQRKLTLAQVPKPPADLAERIKRDIPPHLVMGASSERDRFTRSIFFDMRVAASVLLIVTSAFFALQFFSHADRTKLANLAPAVSRQVAAQPATLTAETARASEPVQVARLQPMSAAAIPQPAPPVVQVRSEPIRERRDMQGREGNVASGLVGGASVVAQDAIAMAAPATAEEVATAPPPPAMAAAPAPVPVVPVEAPAVMGGSFMAEAKAADMAPLRRKTEAVFGISVDQRAFERIKNAIERGEQPESDSIDVAALVNYFAGSARRETHDVRLEAEGSPAPVVSEPGRRMIRVTIDTATAELSPGASVPPVATDAHIDVEFDNAAVLAHHLVGGDGALPSTIESTLLKNTSVTALYDIVLAPRGTSWQRVAVFHLKYTSVRDGKEYTLERTLRRRDLEKSWIAATRRHRLASLGAVWGETLKGMAGANDVARRAEELAMQAPEDAKARELADVANATSQLHGSASGSGR
jgi:hypothetical protein